MPISDSQVRTMKCDGTKEVEGVKVACTNEVTFAHSEAKAIFADPANAWMKTHRIISTPDNRSFIYCSDECELSGVASGQHNLPKPPQVVVPAAGAAAVLAAAKQAAARQEADAALRAGTPPQGKIEIAPA